MNCQIPVFIIAAEQGRNNIWQRAFLYIVGRELDDIRV